MRESTAIGIIIATGAAWLLAAQGGEAAETSDPSEMSKTVVVLKLDTMELLAIRTKSQAHPPIVTIEFPGKRVSGALPERSIIHKGVIEAIFARYEEGTGDHNSPRVIRAIQIALSEPYAHRVRSEPGRIILEVDHPARVGVASMEVGLIGGKILSQFSTPRISERFQAMQEALVQASPKLWSWRVTSTQMAQPFDAPLAAADGQPTAPKAGIGSQAPARSPHPGTMPKPSRSPWTGALVGWGLACGLVVGIVGWRVARRAGMKPVLGSRFFTARRHAVPSGIRLIDQLVWQAFEQQGYQLVQESESQRPPGTLRVIAKDGTRAALLCVGNGVFFEKQTVEEFIAAMRQVDTTQGFLIASGAFTVPAQRLAREHQVTLVGRDQLVQLLTSGAATEHTARQLEELRQQAAEFEGTVRRINNELDAMRRQRNEASWYLGEERASSASIAMRIQALEEELKSVQAASAEWQHQAATLRRQWEESEWYLGESRARAHYLEGELIGLTAQHRALQDACAWLKDELHAVRTFGERRGAGRSRIREGTVEFIAGEEPMALGAGRIRDISGSGFGIETEKEVLPLSPIRIRLNLPGLAEAIEVDADVMWQRAVAQENVFQSGCRFRALDDQARGRLEKVAASG